MKTFINFRSTTPLHCAKERWCDYLKPHSKLNTRKKNIKLAEENGRLIQLIHELNKDIGEMNKREAENGK